MLSVVEVFEAAWKVKQFDFIKIVDIYKYLSCFQSLNSWYLLFIALPIFLYYKL